MLWICNSTAHLPCVSMHKKLEDKRSRPIFTLRLGVMFVDCSLRNWSAVSGAADVVGPQQPPATPVYSARGRSLSSLSVTFVTLINPSFKSDLPPSQSFSLPCLIKPFPTEFASVIKSVSLSTCSTWSLAVSIACTSEKSLFSPLSTSHLLQHPSWLPYSTYLYLDFHLLSMTKLRENSREIC